jgi:hypothetical protein
MALSFQERRHIGSRRLSLFRALFPSWRFFDRLEHVPKIYVRVRVSLAEENEKSSDAWSEWRPLFKRWSRSLVNLYYNPQGNLEFAYHSLTEQLISDLNEFADTAAGSDFSTTVSCRLAERMVRSVLLQNQDDFFVADGGADVGIGRGAEFQFKISVIDILTQQPIDDILVSAPYPLSPTPPAKKLEAETAADASPADAPKEGSLC